MNRNDIAMGRRGFLKCAGAVGGAAALAALAGCSSNATKESSESGSSSKSTDASASSGRHTWEVKPAAITDIAETKEFDIVVVGAGMAGINAAEAAARNGAHVAVIEQSNDISLRGADNGTINCSYQLQEEEGYKEISPENAARMLMQFSQQTTNYDLIYTWASKSGKVFDYLDGLVAAHGADMVAATSPTAKYGWDELDERLRVYPDAVTFTNGKDVGYWREDGKATQYYLGEALVDSAESNGAEFFFKTHAEQLVGDADSGITGVIVTLEDGSHVQFNAQKGVILATGDISGNEEMVDCFAPIAKRADGVCYMPDGGNKGEGMLMGAWAGAAFSKSGAAPMIHQWTIDSVSFNLSSFVMCWLAVDTNGRRYASEMPFEPYLTNARMNASGNIAWSIFDADYATYMQKQLPTTYESVLEGMSQAIEEKVADGSLLRADTLEELASKMGVPADTFASEVETFNGWYEKGEDSQFGVPARFLSKVQTPPFYAVRNLCSVLVIPFGLHVDKNSQVCTEGDEPIDGLFAVGNMQGDFFGVSYPVHYPGISHGRAITFGQLVGEALAKGTVISDL